MIFEPSIRHPVPTTDVLSYLFSNDSYDHDEPLYIDSQDSSRSISHNQARTIIRQLIAGLRAWGVQKGDCVAIHSFNDIYYSMLVLAIVGAGGIFTGTNPSYTPLELAHHLRASRAKFVISEPEILAPLQKAMRDVQVPESNVVVFDALGQEMPSGLRSWRELMTFGEEDWVRFDDEKTSSETPAARLFSSGTTGLPKAATITHRNLIAQHELAFELNRKPYKVRRLIATPVFHAAAAPSTHFGILKSGDICYIMRRFDIAQYLACVEKYEITDLITVPPIVIAIIMTPLTYTRPFFKSVRNALCGAAPLDKNAQTKFKALLADGVPCTQVWGMTETCCLAIMTPYPFHEDTGSVGKLIANLEAKLVDDEGNNISTFGVPGELCVRGPTLIPGYFENDQANAESFDADGWFHTGDVAYCEQSTRNWYIVDRKKELIKVRGFQVAPPELEGVLLTHPLIVDAAVIGISVKDNEELPRAYVVRRPGKGASLTEEEVKAYLGERLAKYKALTGGVKFVDSIPKNPSGKILKKVLREQSQKEVDRAHL